MCRGQTSAFVTASIQGYRNTSCESKNLRVTKSQAQSQFLFYFYFLRRGVIHFTACCGLSAVVPVGSRLITFCSGLVMEITNHVAIRSHLSVRNYDGLIVLGYIAFAIVAIVVLYIASSGPGVTEAELAIATVLP
jgi:hypothetical protein